MFELTRISIKPHRQRPSALRLKRIKAFEVENGIVEWEPRNFEIWTQNCTFKQVCFRFVACLMPNGVFRWEFRNLQFGVDAYLRRSVGYSYHKCVTDLFCKHKEKSGTKRGVRGKKNFIFNSYVQMVWTVVEINAITKRFKMQIWIQ
jgi:hypothetical protein